MDTVETWQDTRYFNTSLTPDQQNFLFRYYPVFGSLWCAAELDVELHVVITFARELRIPKSKIEPDKTAKEIGKELGLTEAEVNIILRSAMKKLRKHLKDKKLSDFIDEW
jgi:hypothetical protein